MWQNQQAMWQGQGYHSNNSAAWQQNGWDTNNEMASGWEQGNGWPQNPAPVSNYAGGQGDFGLGVQHGQVGSPPPNPQLYGMSVQPKPQPILTPQDNWPAVPASDWDCQDSPSGALVDPKKRRKPRKEGEYLHNSCFYDPMCCGPRLCCGCLCSLYSVIPLLMVILGLSAMIKFGFGEVLDQTTFPQTTTVTGWNYTSSSTFHMLRVRNHWDRSIKIGDLTGNVIYPPYSGIVAAQIHMAGTTVPAQGMGDMMINIQITIPLSQEELESYVEKNGWSLDTFSTAMQVGVLGLHAYADATYGSDNFTEATAIVAIEGSEVEAVGSYYGVEFGTIKCTLSMQLQGLSVNTNYVLVNGCDSMQTSGEIVDIIYALLCFIMFLLLWSLAVCCIRIDPMRNFGCVRDVLALPEERGCAAIGACLRCKGTNHALEKSQGLWLDDSQTYQSKDRPRDTE